MGRTPTWGISPNRPHALTTISSLAGASEVRGGSGPAFGTGTGKAMFIPNAGMAGMVQAAASGHFAVDPGTGEQLMMSLSQMLRQVGHVLEKARALDRQTPLGALPEALAISELNRQVAVGDDQSLVPVLQQFKASLEQAHDAVRQGMANYAQVDAAIADNYDRGLAEQRSHERHKPYASGTVTA